MSELQQDKLKIRLHRIEGQVRGIAKMLDEDRSAQDILMQLRAVRAALASVSGLFVAGHLDDQITEIIKTKRQYEQAQAVEQLVSDLQRFFER